MVDFGNIFDKETVEAISSLVENKMDLLNKVTDFNKKDNEFAESIEEFEEELSEEQNEKLKHIMRLHFQMDSYYFTLAYFLGEKHSKQLDKI